MAAAAEPAHATFGPSTSGLLLACLAQGVYSIISAERWTMAKQEMKPAQFAYAVAKVCQTAKGSIRLSSDLQNRKESRTMSHVTVAVLYMPMFTARDGQRTVHVESDLQLP